MNLAEHITIHPYCLAPTTDGLTKEQLAALHKFKHDLTALLTKLYTVVPEARADDLLRQFAATLP